MISPVSPRQVDCFTQLKALNKTRAERILGSNDGNVRVSGPKTAKQIERQMNKSYHIMFFF